MAITSTQGARTRTGLNRAEVQWFISGTDDDGAARAELVSVSAATHEGLTRIDYDVDWQGPGFYEGTVYYGSAEIAQSETGDAVLSLDMTGETAHITHAVSSAPVGAYAPTGGTIPATYGAIGVSDDGVEGVDVIRPAMSVEITYYKANASVTAAYVQGIYALVGRTNNASVNLTASGITLTFAARELLLLGASAVPRGEKDWEFKVRFSARPNVTGLVVGPVTGIAKKGHEYLWARFEDEVDGTAKKVIKKPTAVYVEQVYEDGDYSVI